MVALHRVIIQQKYFGNPKTGSYRQVVAIDRFDCIYHSGRQNCSTGADSSQVLNVAAHPSTMPQKNMISHLVTLY